MTYGYDKRPDRQRPLIPADATSRFSAPPSYQERQHFGTIKAEMIDVEELNALDATVGGWTLSDTQILSGSFKLDSGAERLLIGAATAPLTGIGLFAGKDGSDYEFRVGDPDNDYIHWDGTNLDILGTLSVGSDVGGWTIAATELSSGNVKIQSDAERILMGAATDPTTGVGIFAGKDGTDYELRAGDPSGNRLHWDGTNLVVVGGVTIVSGSGIANLSDAGALATADDADWATQVTGAGKPDDNADVTNANSQNLSWLLGSGEVGFGNVTIDADDEQIRFGSATAPGTGTGIFMGLASAAYQFRVGNPAGDNLLWNGTSLAIVGGVTAESGTIGGWTIGSTELSSGNVTIDAGAERILMGSATAPGTGTGIFAGLASSSYQFRVGNPAGENLLWDGTNLTVTGGGTFSGDLSAAGGTFSGDLSAAGGTFSGNLSAAGGTFSGDISAASGTFTGDLSGATITGGSINIGSGTFTVNGSGELTATSGTFGGTLDGVDGSFGGNLDGATVTTSGITLEGPNTVPPTGATLDFGKWEITVTGNTQTIGGIPSGGYGIETDGSDIKFAPGSGQYLVLANIPTSSPGGSDRVYVDGSGFLKLT